MIQKSRLLFLLLLFTYVGVTPAGVFTCVCFVPNQSLVPLQVGWHDSPGPNPMPHTAVAQVLNYFSLSFLMALAFSMMKRYRYCHTYFPQWLEPFEFKPPPPTPPPFAI
jgi:hypothetical protein